MKSVIRRTSLTVASMAMLATTVLAQTIGPDAGAKARGEVTSSATHQRHAQDHARILYYTMEVNPKAAPAVVLEQAASVKESLAKSDESLKAVKAVHAKDSEVVALVDSILKHHANAAAHCDMAAEFIKKGDPAGKISDCCVDIHNEVELAKIDMAKLTKLLKAEELPVPKKQTPQK